MRSWFFKQSRVIAPEKPADGEIDLRRRVNSKRKVEKKEF
jgi:hypothetical protein